MFSLYLAHYLVVEASGSGTVFNESWSAQVSGLNANFSPIITHNPTFGGPIVANVGFSLIHILDTGWVAQFGASAPFSPNFVYGLSWSGGIGNIDISISIFTGNVFTESFSAGIVTNSGFNINLIIDRNFTGEIDVSAPFSPALTYGLGWSAPVTAVDAGFTLEGIDVILSWDAFVCAGSNFEGFRLREAWELIQAGAAQAWSPISTGTDSWLPVAVSASQLWARVTTQ